MSEQPDSVARMSTTTASERRTDCEVPAVAARLLGLRQRAGATTQVNPAPRLRTAQSVLAHMDTCMRRITLRTPRWPAETLGRKAELAIREWRTA